MSPHKRFEHANWKLVPHHLHASLERWLVEGIEPYSRFLRAVLMNDLKGAVQYASPSDRAWLTSIVVFLLAECPPESFGGGQNVRDWSRMGGWRGMRDYPDKVDIYEH